MSIFVGSLMFLEKRLARSTLTPALSLLKGEGEHLALF